MSNKPNIIVILADDLGYGDFGCYGSKIHKTPHIDKMREDGILFTDFYSSAPQCSPARASLLTGCYPQRVGLGKGFDFPVLLPGDPIGLNQDETTIAKNLKNNAGYSTKIIGKWHLGDQNEFLPLNHGFDSYFGLPSSNDHFSGRSIKERAKLPKRYKDFPLPPLPLISEEKIQELEPDQSKITDMYTNESIKFIEENKDNPFFLFISHMYVHTPLHPPKKYMSSSQNGKYGAEVEHLDFCTGRILDSLKQNDIDENTIVFLTSDNGPQEGAGGSNGFLRGWKNSTWEGGMRVPLIIRWPGKIPPGATCSHMISMMDLYSTISRIADVPLPKNKKLDSIDFSSLLYSEKASPVRDTFFYYNGNNVEAVRYKSWKLHINPDLLYNLDSDCGEQNNLIENHPEIAELMRKKIYAMQRELGDERYQIKGSECRAPGWVETPKPPAYYLDFVKHNHYY